jgi:glycogen(starch) synthase
VRVVYLVERFWPLLGGVEVLSARLLPDLRARGHEIVVVTGREHESLPEEDTYAGMKVHRLPLTEPLHDRDLPSLLAVQRRVTAIVRELGAELVHVAFTGAAIFYVKRSVLGDARTIVSVHGSWPQITLDPRSALVRVFEDAARVTACSRSALADLEQLIPSMAGRGSVILNGIDPASPAPPGPPPAGPPVFLASGRVVFDKGFDLAVDALARVPEARLVIAGDGAERANLEQRAATRGVADRVEFTGWVAADAMGTLVARATAVLVPSRLEGFGLVALEAALGGRPVIAARVGGLPEVVADGTTGILVDPGDADALAEGMVALMSNRERAARMGEQGRERALREFSATRHADDWDALYREVGGAR